MSQVAFFTFGVLHEQRGHPKSQGFIELTPTVFEAADATPGYISRATPLDLEPIPHNISVSDLDFGLWGKYAAPRFYQGTLIGEARRSAQTLSLWIDLESVYRFAYQGWHLEALRKRKEWFQSGEWPTYVIWWVADGDIPTWQQACIHLEHLHDHGPTADAFDFKHPFDSNGAPTRI